MVEETQDISIQQCDLTGSIGYLVQGILGFLAFASLVIKRQYEQPKRQVKIWILDTSKQGISQLVAHVLNVILAMILSNKQNEDPCNWYFITILFDTTIGVLVCYIILKIVESFFDKTGLNKFKTGNYFKTYNSEDIVALNENNRNQNQNLQVEKVNLNNVKPIIQVDYAVWLIQLLVWVAIVVGSKSVLYFIQQALSKFLLALAGFLFSGLDNAPNLKLVIVMVIIPLFLNCCQFWVQDNFLKKNNFTSQEEEFLSEQIFMNKQQQNNNNMNNDDIIQHNQKVNKQNSIGDKDDSFASMEADSKIQNVDALSPKNDKNSIKNMINQDRC